MGSGEACDCCRVLRGHVFGAASPRMPCLAGVPALARPSHGRIALCSQRATNELDQVPSPELGSEGIFYRHGHRGLLTPQQCACLADSTTMKDAYRRPVPTGLPRRGQREAMLELMLYHKYREETLREHCPRPAPMESLSTMHQDYRREGFCSAPPPPTQVSPSARPQAGHSARGCASNPRGLQAPAPDP
ncbi:sperm-associated antigen 8 [Alligator sinensis]|uniref:Sperm-associated antigen 8 n=1 Tax=Alligator sinensis TaxID=38654 RepID=A0A3Q0FPM1_ALLSI|nr:sperm-associated antigen 8 [Alligator sinensis]